MSRFLDHTDIPTHPVRISELVNQLVADAATYAAHNARDKTFVHQVGFEPTV